MCIEKKCRKCGQIKKRCDFSPAKHHSDGLKSHCKKCCYLSATEKDKIRIKEWCIKNKEIIKEKRKIYYQNNKTRFIEMNNKWRKENPEKSKKSWNKQNAQRYSTVKGRLIRTIGSRLYHNLLGIKNRQRYEDLVGYNINQLKQHLENLFKDGMSWENYGNGHGKWSIDHIRPLKSFDLTQNEERKKCFHYSNLQPMWSPENSSKSDDWDGVTNA